MLAADVLFGDYNPAGKLSQSVSAFGGSVTHLLQSQTYGQTWLLIHQQGTVVSFRLWSELYNFRIFEFEGKSGADWSGGPSEGYCDSDQYWKASRR